MNYKLLILFIVPLLIFSCKKDEQSCDDGVFDPELEEQTDCGGVCPPCSSGTNDDIPYVFAKINTEPVSFGDYSLSKTSDWNFHFENDSISIFLNLGDGDSTGYRPIDPSNSKAVYKGDNYTTLISGNVLFSDVDHSKNRLSGYFEGEFAADANPSIRLKIVDGEFDKVNW